MNILRLLGVFIILGFPRIPNTEYPIFLLMLPFFALVIFRIINSSLKPFITFLTIFVFWLLWSCFCWLFSDNANTSDLFFLFILAAKFILGVTGGVVLYYIVQKNVGILIWWVLIQLVIIILSSFNESIYMSLIQFISPRSAATFENIYGLRSIGFGIYHIEGGVLLVFLLAFLAITSKGVNRNILVYLGGGVALLMSRSVIIPVILYTYISAGAARLALLIFSFVALGWGASHLSEGIVFEAFELFINLYEGKGVSTRSTDALAHMVIITGDVKTYLFGDGMFYNPSEPGFYMGTDIGYLRVFYFSGVLGVLLFCVLNVYFCLHLCRVSNSLNVSKMSWLLILLVLIINVKGIFIVLLMSTFLMCMAKEQCRRGQE